MLAAFTGESLDVEIIWFMRILTAAKQTMTIKLNGAFVSDISAVANLDGSSASDFEQVSLSYSRITFSAPNIDAQGQTAGPAVTVCLDVANNSKC